MPLVLITPKLKAATAADRWKEQYQDKWHRLPEMKPIYHNLVGLGPDPSPEDVDKVIGNDSWTGTKCSSCETTRVPVVQVGQELDYESMTAYLCIKCLKEAVFLIEGHT